MKVWITKYALSEGIIACERSPRDHSESDGYAVVIWPGGLNGTNVFGRNDWYKSERDALARAEQMRTAKIASLEKQIARLRGLKFGDEK